MESRTQPHVQSHVIASPDGEGLFKHLHPELVKFLKTSLDRGDTFITGSRVIELVYPVVLSAFFTVDPGFNDVMLVTHQWGEGTKALIDSIREFTFHECKIIIPQSGKIQRLYGKSSIFCLEIFGKGSLHPSVVLSVSVNSLRDISRCLVRVESIFFDGKNVRIFNPEDLSLYNPESIVRKPGERDHIDDRVEDIRDMLIETDAHTSRDECVRVMERIVDLASALVAKVEA